MISDACPGVVRLHEAADGHLARVRLPGGMIDAAGLRAVAAAASRGNGIVELTSRAGLQVRGLRADGAGHVACVLASGGLLPSVAHERVRNIVAPPLGGRARGALADTDAVVERLDHDLCADRDLVTLPGRFLFAVDDGTRALTPLAADVELAAERDGFRLALAGRATELMLSAESAPGAAIAAARAFVALLATEAPNAWRVGDIPRAGRRLAERMGLPLQEQSQGAPAPASAGAAGRRPGVIDQRDGRAAVSALPPLGRLEPDQLLALAELTAPGAAVRVSPWRTVTFVDVPAPDAPGLADALAAIGLVVEGGSGWAGLSACAGLGACSRARADVRAAAALRAPRRGDDAPREHWSGCERRCGEPRDAGVTVVATAAGLLVDRRGGETDTVATAREADTVATAAEAVELLATPGVSA
ncbi:MAG: precorrin-3B synthase [Solirubrobacteraceae bacterium]|nr:precorrin-3B synthase [Solirubrobacteraceae bacterium]